MIRSKIRRRKIIKAQSDFIGSSFAGGGSPAPNLGALSYVPIDPDYSDQWAVPDKPIRAKEGIHSDKTITSAGDIVARKPNAVVFAAADDAAGGSQYLYQLLDVNITNPVNGAMLVYDAATQKWNNANEIVIDGGTYSII